MRLRLNVVVLTIALSSLICVKPEFARSQTSTIGQSQRSDSKTEGDRAYQQGNQQYQASRYKEAISSFEDALRLYREIGDRNQMANALTGLGRTYRSLSQYDKAISYYEQALLIHRELRNRNSEAVALNNIGNAYNFSSQYNKAISYLEQALPIFRKLSDQRNEAITLNNLGTAYRLLSQYNKAISYLEQALLLSRKVGDQRNEVIVLYSLGIVYNLLSQYNKAISYSEQALPILRKLGDRNGEAVALSNLGTAYRLLSQPNKAVGYYEQALLLNRKIYDRNGEAAALNSLGTTYRFLFQYNKAVSYHEQALPIYREVNDRNGEAGALNNLGLAYRSLAQYDKAIRYLEQALPIFRAVQNRNGEAVALNNLGSAYYSLSQYDKAIGYYEQALPMLRAVRDRNTEAITLNGLGLSLLQIGRFAQAEQSLQTAIGLFESIRLDGLAEQDKISLFEGQRGAYRALQQVLIAQNKPEAALSVSEWGRTKALVERLSQQLRPMAIPSTTTQAPDVAQLKQIAQTQNATLVEYSVIYDSQKGSAKELYIWTIQPTGAIAFRRINIAAVLPKQCPSIAQLVAQSRNAIGVRGWDQPENWVQPSQNANPCLTTDPKQNLTTLHRLLIEPIKDLLPTDPNQTIVFVPQDSLFLVPFPALLDANGKYLIEQHTIQTAPSIQLLAQTHRLRATPKGTGALVVGNPTMPKLRWGSRTIALPPLPGSEQEAVAIAPMFNTKALSHTAATKAEVLKQMPNARIIHLSTHGLFNNRDGLKSAIALAPTSTDNGFLTAEEILKLNLKAELVVLSACNSGRGSITGDGVVGLSRSFIAAGVPSVLVSLWSVPDAPTAKLMTEFYTQLRSRPNKAEALRQAMLKTMQTHPEPKNWAAFTLIGEE